MQKQARHHGHSFPPRVDPYVVPGNPASGLLPRISARPPGEDGQGDRRIQAYCFRMCLTDVPENRVPFPKPGHYDARQYELVLRVFATGWRETFRKFDPIPNGKTDTNNHGPFSTDNIGMNYAYPEASHAARREIVAEHARYQKGLLYFLANDQRVPDDVRQEFSQWGLAGDEFSDNGNWPHQLYVRESRRLRGEFVMTEHECLAKRPVPRLGRHGIVCDGLPQCAALRDVGWIRPKRGRHRREAATAVRHRFRIYRAEAPRSCQSARAGCACRRPTSRTVRFAWSRSS